MSIIINSSLFSRSPRDGSTLDPYIHIHTYIYIYIYICIPYIYIYTHIWYTCIVLCYIILDLTPRPQLLPSPLPSPSLLGLPLVERFAEYRCRCTVGVPPEDHKHHICPEPGIASCELARMSVLKSTPSTAHLRWYACNCLR